MTKTYKKLGVMNYLDYKEIECTVNYFANLIKAPKNELPTYGHSRDFAYPHIEIDINGYHYVIVERGQEQERKTTKEINEFLYWIFEPIAFSMATQFELKNRIKDKDPRRIGFKKQEEILGKLNSEWENKRREEHQEILKCYPFDDLAGLRATYCRELRGKGLGENEIDKFAYKKYPIDSNENK